MIPYMLQAFAAAFGFLFVVESENVGLLLLTDFVKKYSLPPIFFVI
jgi:hypothetical protein